jgi:hypothetical protein
VLYQEPEVGATEVCLPTKSNSCPRVLHNRLWRFPFKPPALLGVIDSPAKPPALPERIEEVIRLRDKCNGLRRHTTSLGEPRGPQGNRNFTGLQPSELGGRGDPISEGEKLDLDCAECGA